MPDFRFVGSRADTPNHHNHNNRRGSTKGNTRHAADFLSPRRAFIANSLSTWGLRPHLHSHPRHPPARWDRRGSASTDPSPRSGRPMVATGASPWQSMGCSMQPAKRPSEATAERLKRPLRGLGGPLRRPVPQARAWGYPQTTASRADSGPAGARNPVAYYRFFGAGTANDASDDPEHLRPEIAPQIADSCAPAPGIASPALSVRRGAPVPTIPAWFNEG